MSLFHSFILSTTDKSKVVSKIKWVNVKPTTMMNNFPFSIDATNEKSFGRLVNDSPSAFANAVMKRICLDGVVHLCLYAVQDIEKDVEIR